MYDILCSNDKREVAHGIQCMPHSSQIISGMLPEFHSMEKFSQTYNSF